MLTSVRRVTGPAVVGMVTVVMAGMTLTASNAAAQESASAPLARQLATALEEAQLDSVAAKDTEGEDRFVAALFFPGQLLVVSARYEAPIYVEEKIAARTYREVYLDLNTASIAESRVQITDGGANGLRSDEPADSAKTGGQPIGFSAADADYARILRALLAELD
jgi:hypothetical protein